MNANRRIHKVTLSNAATTTPDSDGYFQALEPEAVFAAIEPLTPSPSDGTRITPFAVLIPYHAQVAIDTRIVYGTRQLFVKGVQNVDERNREMRLYCEEAV